jgi:hypothetical protein
MNVANLKYLLVYIVSITITLNNYFYICNQDNGKNELESSLFACSELECNENDLDSSLRFEVKSCTDNAIIIGQLTNSKEPKQVSILCENVIQFKSDKLDTKYLNQHSSINFHNNISMKIIESTILLI